MTMASESSLLGLMNQLQSLESSMAVILMESAMKISSLTGTYMTHYMRFLPMSAMRHGVKMYTFFFYKILVYKILSLDFLQNLRTNPEQAQAGLHVTLTRSLFLLDY